MFTSQDGWWMLEDPCIHGRRVLLPSGGPDIVLADWYLGSGTVRRPTPTSAVSRVCLTARWTGMPDRQMEAKPPLRAVRINRVVRYNYAVADGASYRAKSPIFARSPGDPDSSSEHRAEMVVAPPARLSTTSESTTSCSRRVNLPVLAVQI